MKTAKLVLRSLMFFCLAPATSGAQGLSDLNGTYQVAFAPMQSGGRLQGCSLVFKAIAEDHVYQSGRPILLVGNVTVYTAPDKKGFALAVKLGIGDPLNTAAPFEAPAVAYLQTRSANTASALADSQPSDIPGYRMFVYRITDESTMTVMKEMLESNSVTIGFNRHRGGLDLLVPIDLSVIDTVHDGKGFKRQHSPQAVLQYSECSVNVVQEVQRTLAGAVRN